MTPQPTDEELAEHIFEHLCEEQPEALEALSDVEIQRRIRVGIRRAAANGFTEPEPVTAFVTLMVLVSPGFDQHPAIARAIRAGHGSQAEKLRALFEKTKEEDWAEAAGLGSWDEAAETRA